MFLRSVRRGCNSLRHSAVRSQQPTGRLLTQMPRVLSRPFSTTNETEAEAETAEERRQLTDEEVEAWWAPKRVSPEELKTAPYDDLVKEGKRLDNKLYMLRRKAKSFERPSHRRNYRAQQKARKVQLRQDLADVEIEIWSRRMAEPIDTYWQANEATQALVDANKEAE